MGETLPPIDQKETRRDRSIHDAAPGVKREKPKGKWVNEVVYIEGRGYVKTGRRVWQSF